ncbi:hypothetical protein PQX77_015792 [Marasmius sp. AFHP31]|nr:hypothetical protein PQX77_015792 [Marasmius sp. AFHP31]
MGSQFFSSAINTTIGDYCTFQHVERNVNNNYIRYTSYQECKEDRVMPKQSHFRTFFMGDVISQEETGSIKLDVLIRKRSTNPFRPGVETRVKVVRKHHTTTFLLCGDKKFTVVTLEPEDKKDEEATRFLWKAGYEALSAHRSIQFPKMVGLMRSDVPSFVLYQELADGVDLFSQYIVKETEFEYLEYTRYIAIQAIRANTTLKVSEKWRNWSFDVNAKTWHYDIARASLAPPQEDYFPYYTPTPLPPGTTPPLLDADDIITCFEKTFGDALYMWASLGRIYVRDLSDYAQHGLLTLGALTRSWKGILAHFPSPPTPEWAFENHSRGIKANYSSKDLFINDIRFLITGNFSPNLLPAYLFVPPLPVKIVNGMHCISYPLPNPLFYWAADSAGVNVIPEKEWEKYGISELAVETMAGSSWTHERYRRVRDYMHKKGFEPTDGKRYARDHGYPELILSDPHDQRMVELNNSDTHQYFCSDSESTSSLESPMNFDSEDAFDSNSQDEIESYSGDALECDSEHTLEQEQAQVSPKDEGTMTRWVKRLGFLKNAYISPSRDESDLLKRAASEAKKKKIDSDSWYLVDRED